MISAAALARMQAIIVANFDRTCVISRPSKAVDGKGHSKPTWTVLNGGAVKCAFYKGTGQIIQASGGELSSNNRWLLQVPVNTDVKGGDRIVLGTETLHVQSTGGEQTLPGCLDIDVLVMEGAPEDTP